VPTGLIFVGAAGGVNPAPKTFSITNLTSNPITYSAGAFFDTGKNWYAPLPTSGTVAPGKPVTISV
jgi:hypothetical protein